MGIARKSTMRHVVHDEHHHEYFVDWASVANVTHDEHGNAGMELANDMFEAIAKKLRLKLEHE